MPSATTTDGRVLDSRAANNDAAAFQKRMNNSRFIPPILPRIKQIQQDRVHVFSVSPWSHTVSMGAWGMFTIPACPSGEDCIEFLMHDSEGNKSAVPGIMIQYYPQDENRMGMHEEDGRDWAEKLLGNDSGINPAFSLNRFGVKVVKGEKPTNRELAEMNEELHNKLLELIQQAREWEGDPIKKQGIRPEVHFVAARLLNLTDESWMVQNNPQGRQKCPMCGTYSDPDVIKCGACKEYIFDHKAYAAMLAQQSAQQTAAAKG